jgi:hypothetical protein
VIRADDQSAGGKHPRCSAPVRGAGQFGNPYSRAIANRAAESVSRSETA